MAKIQANEYAYATLSSVREAVKGRLQSLEIPVGGDVNVYPNGVLFHKGALLPNETHVFKADATVREGRLPWVLAMPEINTQQYRTSDGALGKWRNKAGKALVGAQLSLDDVIIYSDAYFATVPVEKEYFELKLGGEKFTKKELPVEGDLLFQVTHVKDAYLPAFIDGAGKVFPTSPKEVWVMVVEYHA